MSKVEWASFTFPALNLWNMPKHSEIVRMINEYYYEHYKHLWEEDNKPMRKPSPVVWVMHTAFGKTKKVPVSVHNADLETPNPKVHWIERDEDLYGLPRNQTAYILRAEDFRRADIHDQ